MTARRPDPPVPLDRSREAVLRAATRVLVEAPQTSLGDLAVTIGIGRTTLHRMFPTRRDLLVAIAHDAIDHLTGLYADVGLGPEPVAAADALPVLRRLVTGLVPLGPSLQFLLRAVELDDDAHVTRRTEQLDRLVQDAVAAAGRHGDLDTDVGSWWAAELLFAGVYVAWEQIERGRLAPLDAPDLVVRTWLRGVGGAPGPASG